MRVSLWGRRTAHLWLGCAPHCRRVKLLFCTGFSDRTLSDLSAADCGERARTEVTHPTGYRARHFATAIRRGARGSDALTVGSGPWRPSPIKASSGSRDTGDASGVPQARPITAPHSTIGISPLCACCHWQRCASSARRPSSARPLERSQRLSSPPIGSAPQ